MVAVLRELYLQVYGEKFSFDDFDHRIKLQKAIYLLNNMGIGVGDYSFVWDNRGPYSLSLDCDACAIRDCNDTTQIQFSDKIKTGISALRGILSKKEKYTDVLWVECLASLHYLKSVMRIEHKNLLSELQRRKPYLNEENENLNALRIISSIAIVN